MKEITYKIYNKEEITDDIADDFLKLLKKQEKVRNPNTNKIKLCRQIILCYVENNFAGIGALKPKTRSDFNILKADLPNLEEKFEWELGYFYTDPNYRKLGIASIMTKLLLYGKENENFLATTEIYNTNPMIYILEKHGFRQCGKVWKSTIHDGVIGLFLKINEGQIIKNENK